jgi:ferredoxin
MLRNIVKIDEEKCDGCGLCATACAEGAIQIIDGKARLVSETYCDGLGACLGECPQGAITIEEREASAFDEELVSEHLAEMNIANEQPKQHPELSRDKLPCGCPGSASRMIDRKGTAKVDSSSKTAGPVESQLVNWPVQLKLVPLEAPYFRDAHLLIAADCVPFAHADFHRRMLSGRTLIIGCPKLDDAEFYLEKLAEIFRRNDIQSVEVVFMEVPCCFGLVRLVKMALDASGKDIPVAFTKVGIRGDIMETVGEKVIVGAE